MKLHEFEQEFRQLISIVARQKHISESAVERDYYMLISAYLREVLLLVNAIRDQ